jgi:hypothetical protein
MLVLAILRTCSMRAGCGYCCDIAVIVAVAIVPSTITGDALVLPVGADSFASKPELAQGRAEGEETGGAIENQGARDSADE